MGLQGCGKSSFINLATGIVDCMTSANSKLCTKSIHSCKHSTWINGNEVGFIDTPGFGNEILDDRRILEMLVEYLAPNPHGDHDEFTDLPRRVTGLLYIHSEDETFKDRTSQKTVEMLVKILGGRFLNRVTVLITSQDNTRIDTSKIIQSKDSPIYPFYSHPVKPWATISYTQNSHLVERILEFYTGMHPRPVQLAALSGFARRNGAGSSREGNIPQYLREFFPEDIGPRVVAVEPGVQSHSQEQENTFEEPGSSLIERAIDVFRTSRDTEPRSTEKDDGYEKIAHEIEINYQNLCEMIRSQGERISSLKSSRDSELKELEAVKSEELSRLTSEMDSEIKALQDGLQAKDEEILQLKEGSEELERLSRGKDSEIKVLRDLLAQKEDEITELRSSHSDGLKDIQKFVLEIELSCQGLRQTIQDREGKNSRLEMNKDGNFGGSEARLKSHQFEQSNSEKDSEINVLQRRLGAKDEELTSVKADYERRIRELTNAAQVQGVKVRAKGTITETKNMQVVEISRLQEEIRQTKAEYAALRHQMCLEENTEQADITTILADVNRLIEEFGQALSEHLETYMEQSPHKKPLQLDMLGLFGPVEGGLASKFKQDAYSLFEYAIQANICDMLCTHLFKPFHPCIADDEKRNTSIMRLYEQVAYQEPQAVAGRWRRDAFNSISRDSSLGSRNPDNGRMHQIIIEALSPILRKFPEIEPHEVLKDHDKALVKIIAKAEEFNRLLKANVVMLGDFQPVGFTFGEAFQPDYMSYISVKKKAKRPSKILATVELGLTKNYAVGEGRKPEQTVIRKAGVVGLPK